MCVSIALYANIKWIIVAVVVVVALLVALSSIAFISCDLLIFLLVSLVHSFVFVDQDSKTTANPSDGEKKKKKPK